MFEHFRIWLKNPRIVETICLILSVLVFVAVLKHYNLYEGFAKQELNKEQKLEYFLDKPNKITNM